MSSAANAGNDAGAGAGTGASSNSGGSRSGVGSFNARAGIAARGRTPDGKPITKSQLELMETNQGLVKSIAFKINQKLPPQVELDDLIAYGQIGLAQAARDFDPSLGYAFSTFAYHRIRGAILDGLKQMSWFKIHDYYNSQYERTASEVAQAESQQENDEQDGTVQEEAEHFESTVKKMAMVYLLSDRQKSVNADEQGDSDFFVDEHSPQGETTAMQSELTRQLWQAVDELPEDGATLIRSIYQENMTLQDAAKKLNISKGWASRLHGRTLDRLADNLKQRGITSPN